MGWSHLKPVARTNLASGPALPAGAAPWPGLGAEMWEGWFLCLFFVFFFFFRASETPELITLFLILVGGFFYLGTFGWRLEEVARSGWMRMEKGTKDMGLDHDGDQG